MGACRVGSLRGFQIVTCKITDRHGPRRPDQTGCQTRKPSMPQHASRPLSAIMFHQESELRAVAKFHTVGKGHSPKRWPSLSRALQNLHFMSSLFRLAEQKPIPYPSRKDGSQQHFVSFSQVRRARSWWNHEYQNKTHPETLSSCINQWPLYPARLSIWHCGSAAQDQSSCEVEGDQA